MKSAAFLLCLLAATRAGAVEPSVSDDTRNQRPRATPEYRIREVRFAGDPAFDTDALKEVLKELKVRRWIPGVWTRRPRYDARALDADLARLRSFYLSNGYFDARVEIGDVTFDGREATITLQVQSGPKSRVRPVNIEGLFNEHGRTLTEPNGDFPVDHLCKCLLDTKRIAEAHGRIDFAAELEISEASGATPGSESNWVDVTARVRAGSPYLVGRISFSGHHRVNDSTLRRAMALQERALFDVGKLRQSLARLNRSGLLEPITADDVEIERNPAGLTADLTISLRERPRGLWSLSGPVVATRLTGSLQGTISSRLPAWGRGVFEASTYYVTFSLIGLPNPLLRLLPFAPRPRLSPLLVLERPYLPGQAVFSGFALSPMRPARTMLTSYAVTHLSRGARGVLGSDPVVPSTLLVPVQTSHASVDDGRSSAGFLICEPPDARLRWLRRGAAYAADLALGAFRPF
jgi:hypothetical protein